MGGQADRHRPKRPPVAREPCKPPSARQGIVGQSRRPSLGGRAAGLSVEDGMRWVRCRAEVEPQATLAWLGVPACAEWEQVVIAAYEHFPKQWAAGVGFHRERWAHTGLTPRRVEV